MSVNKRKDKILDVAHRLFIKKGFHATSIQDILNAAEISKGTFYNYFGSKNECLLAILESVQEEGDQKRMGLLQGKSKQDEEIFIQQIAVRTNINSKYNMLILFESLMHLDEPIIKNFFDNQYRNEVHWIATRICEVYSPEDCDYSLDHAIMLLGMFQHFMYVWKMETGEEIEAEKVIQFILNRMKPIIQEQIQSSKKFFPVDWFSPQLDDISKEEVLTQLEKNIDSLLDKATIEQIDYIKFLKEEILSNNPRKFLIESIVLSLTNIFEETEMEYEVKKLVQLIEKYLNKI
ncbi:TetR/AcrR family transcriptional regulator [Paucisalibacillus globulus]|uniref:TetR/AcrR family transcriptional regulator n=1 Tax=Paucisalibacillus globulus TaxID=351095 RepID=UPI00041AE36B|nr:TetR/AcrR family transcriptional regulator [Paucisalibacillus globulus]